MKVIIIILIAYSCILQEIKAQNSVEETIAKISEAISKNDISTAINYSKKALVQAEQTGGKNYDSYGQICKILAALYYKNGEYTLAKKYFREYVTICSDLASLNLSQELFKQAELLYLEAKAINIEFLKEDIINYITTCNKLGICYLKQNLYSIAEPLYLEIKSIIRLKMINDDRLLATICNNLGACYEGQGLYSEAEKLYFEAQVIQEKALGKDHLDYANTCLNLASLYTNEGSYSKAEPLYLQAKLILKKNVGNEHLDYALLCNNFGAFYAKQGLYFRAEPLYYEAKFICEKNLGKNYSLYILCCSNIAALYYAQGLYSDAESFYLKRKTILEASLGKQNSDYGMSCNDLGVVYNDLGLYAKAEQLLVEAKIIIEKVLGKEHPTYALICNNLAECYLKQGLYVPAQLLHMNAKTIREQSLGRNHSDYILSCNNLAMSFFLQHRYKEAEPFFIETIQSQLKQINTLLSTFSEKEKLAYLRLINTYFLNYLSFVLIYFQEKPSLIGELYDLTLKIKSLIYYSNYRMLEEINNKGDSELTSLYERWRDQNNLLVKVWQMSNTERQQRNINVIQEEEKSNLLEKLVSLKVGIKPFQDKTSRREVQAKLKSSEAVVEIIRTTVYDSINEKKIDTVYVALINYPNTQQPALLVLQNGDFMERKAIKYYRNSINSKLEDTLSYNVFWKDISKELHAKKIKKVYFSGDGIYHQINLQTLKNPVTHKYLFDEIDIQLISSSKDLLIDKYEQTNDSTIHIFGDPYYSDVNNDSSSQNLYLQYNDWVLLEGSKAEVSCLDSIANQCHIKSKLYTEKKATEANLKKMESPYVLHISTHGFFLPDIENNQETRGSMIGIEANKIMENPLLKSGLVFSNCKDPFLGLPNKDEEDGILTAQEALSLHLNGTKLVVLSACETGLGEVKNGEGVYGLQRSIRQAGAETILMSLWKVDDNAAKLLMIEFYKNLLLKRMTKKEAFKKAQTYLRNSFKEPYYWGAFVMVGN